MLRVNNKKFFKVDFRIKSKQKLGCAKIANFDESFRKKN